MKKMLQTTSRSVHPSFRETPSIRFNRREDVPFERARGNKYILQVGALPSVRNVLKGSHPEERHFIPNCTKAGYKEEKMLATKFDK